MTSCGTIGVTTERSHVAMRKINYFDREVTVEEYVKSEILLHQGGNHLTKEQLYDICQEKGIPCRKSLPKEEFWDLLMENGVTCEEMARHVGVSSQIYQKTFGISHQDVKRLEKHGVLKVVSYYQYRAFGDYHFAPLYDVYQFGKMTDKDMQNLLEEYPKGKKVKK
mgnify:CR=1 FL=1